MTTETKNNVPRCPRCVGGVLIAGWQPGERSCIQCGFEIYPRTLLEEIARAEVEADAARDSLRGRPGMPRKFAR